MTALMLILAALTQADEVVRLDVSRDTWLSGVGPEADGANGGSPRLKLKSIQEFTILDFEGVERVRGRVVKAATLHVRSTGEPRLKRVTVAGLASGFHEGTATSYGVAPGQSTFNRMSHPDIPWAADGDVTNVMFGPRGALWGTADASTPDAEGWQTIAVDPRVVAARGVGLAGGFTVFDDTGTEWTRDGEKFERTLFPNRFLYGRDQNRAAAPYLTLVLGPKDNLPPDPPGELRVEAGADRLPAGEAVMSWIVPEDRGSAGTLGFRMSVGERPLAPHRVPVAGRAGGRLSVRLGREDEGDRVEVRAVDAAGNESEPAVLAVQPLGAGGQGAPPAPAAPRARPVALPKLGGAEVAVVDELDVVNPASGERVPPGDRSYLASNHLFDAGSKTIRLSAGRGEAVAFQVVVGNSMR